MVQHQAVWYADWYFYLASFTQLTNAYYGITMCHIFFYVLGMQELTEKAFLISSLYTGVGGGPGVCVCVYQVVVSTMKKNEEM